MSLLIIKKVSNETSIQLTYNHDCAINWFNIHKANKANLIYKIQLRITTRLPT
ncbi:hypothetical protein VCR8J2_850044 [Vibrio coralliirubri]|nr:hypothetical protein VCR8J2_850044 [Vibrio coralliirubri]